MRNPYLITFLRMSSFTIRIQFWCVFVFSGIPLGSCSTVKDLVCCHELSCSLKELEHLESDDFLKRKKRSTSDIVDLSIVEPLCGFSHDPRLDQKMSRLSQQMRFGQLISGIDVHDSAKYPWMLSLWKSSDSEKKTFLPTCGAALISLRHAITAAHCVNNQVKKNCNQSIQFLYCVTCPIFQKSVVLRGGSTINRLSPTEGGSILSVERIGMSHYLKCSLNSGIN